MITAKKKAVARPMVKKPLGSLTSIVSERMNNSQIILQDMATLPPYIKQRGSTNYYKLCDNDLYVWYHFGITRDYSNGVHPYKVFMVENKGHYEDWWEEPVR
jgi:hypothetical protein